MTMQKNNIRNVLAQAIRPSRFRVMLKKVLKRIVNREGGHTPAENLQWIESHRSDFRALATGLDADLWEEAESTGKTLEQRAERILKGIEYGLGGGAAYPFLYFIARYTEPECIVETGVAAGYSSSAFLLAIEKNGKGRLYSSDFPYFRLPDPEKYVGVIVDESLKGNWTLYLDGDEINLPKIANRVDSVDLFHYDSDKSYSGREFAVSTIGRLLSSRGIILMDDIQDNAYFYDYVESNKPESWSVFEFQGKFIGMIGKLSRRSA